MKYFLTIITISLIFTTPKYKEFKPKVIIDKGFQLPEGYIFELIDYYADSLNVLREFVYDVGMNESGWRYPDSVTYIRICGIDGEDSRGDIQVNNPNKYLDSITRATLLEFGITYMSQLYKRYGDWEKVRYAYARGNWKPKSQWSCLEIKFMNKMDFKKYK